MPYVEVNGTKLWYEQTGENGPPIVFSHGLLWSGKMFEKQVAHLSDRFRCITYDHRGQGRSDVPSASSISIEDCYADAVALIEKLGLGPCHFVGLSMGGFVGMRLAARRPDLLRSLVLLETSAEPEPQENVPRYRLLNLVARWLGLSLVANRVMKIMFGRTFLTDPARAADRATWRAQLVGNRRDIWRAVNGVIDRAPIVEELAQISVPTLVAVGDEDVATVPAKAERIVARIPGARLARIPRAGHTSTVEAPVEVCRILDEFLGEVGNAKAAGL